MRARRIEKTKGIIDTINRANFDLKHRVEGLDNVDELVASVHCQREVCAYVRQFPSEKTPAY